MMALLPADFFTAPQTVLFFMGVASMILWGFMWFKADQRYETKPVLDKKFQDLWDKIERVEITIKADAVVLDAKIKAVETMAYNQNEGVHKSINDLRTFIQAEFMTLVSSVSEMRGQLRGMNTPSK